MDVNGFVESGFEAQRATWVTSVMIADHSGAVTSRDASGARPGVETGELSLLPAQAPITSAYWPLLRSWSDGGAM